MNNIIPTTGSTRQLSTFNTLPSKTGQKYYHHQNAIISPMTSKEIKGQTTSLSIHILEGQNQAIGSFRDQTPYQISGAGNPHIEIQEHQVRVPEIEYDQHEISLFIQAGSVFIRNIGTAPLETVNFQFVRPETESPPTRVTLNPDESLDLKLDKTAIIEISWISEQDKGEQHVTTRFTLDQDHRQIQGSCEVRPIPHS